MPKPFLTYEQQISLLKSKGLCISDDTKATETLMHIGYFQLIGGYKHCFKNSTTKKYLDGTTFDDIVALYHFDENLRHLFLEHLLIVERNIKTQMSYAFCLHHGADQAHYLNNANYHVTPLNRTKVMKLIGILNNLATSPTDYPYINHHQKRHHNVPLWVLINAITFGSMSKMFEYFPQSLQSQIAKQYPLNISDLMRLLSVLTKYRNACAHGERLFTYKTTDAIPNLLIHEKLKITKKNEQFIYGKNDLFAVVISFRYLLPNDDFKSFKKSLAVQIASFLSDCDNISEDQLHKLMGLPTNWKKITSFSKIKA